MDPKKTLRFFAFERGVYISLYNILYILYKVYIYILLHIVYIYLQIIFNNRTPRRVSKLCQSYVDLLQDSLILGLPKQNELFLPNGDESWCFK